MANVVSYTVNRRSPLQALGTAAASPYNGQLPQAGTAYEYQVVSVGKGNKNSAGSAWVPYTVPVPTATISPGVILMEPKLTTGTVRVIPAGPTQLTAGSSIPGQIRLGWNEVANATAYRVPRYALQ